MPLIDSESDLLSLPNKHCLRIGIVNLMPEAEKYEHSILSRLGRSERNILPVWIRSEVHTYGSSDKDHLSQLYNTFSQAIRERPLNGLIITGAPVEKIPFEEVRYWDEISDIMAYAWKNISGTMGLCWGGLAMAKFLGIGKTVHEKKIFGVFPSQNLNPEHPVTGSSGNPFYCPQSRYAGFDEADLKDASTAGKIELLAFAEETGHFIFSSFEKNFIGHIGHPEYTVERILFEYHRDQKAGLKMVPEYFNTENPSYNWKDSGTSFFTNWVDCLEE